MVLALPMRAPFARPKQMNEPESTHSARDHCSVTHSVEIVPADRDGLVMAKLLFATTL